MRPNMPRPVKYHSAFDIIGPVMVGPSSSHTAGALRIARMARKLLGQDPSAVVFELMGSFAETYRGHGTDQALTAGILGFATDDSRIPRALEMAKALGISVVFTKVSGALYHPNTVRIKLTDGVDDVDIVGTSLGGGKIELIEIDAFPVHLSGDRPAVVLWHKDRAGFLATMLAAVANVGVNVGQLSLERSRKDGDALVAIEFDGACTVELLDALDGVHQAVQKIRWIKPV